MFHIAPTSITTKRYDDNSDLVNSVGILKRGFTHNNNIMNTWSSHSNIIIARAELSCLTTKIVAFKLMHSDACMDIRKDKDLCNTLGNTFQNVKFLNPTGLFPSGCGNYILHSYSITKVNEIFKIQ